jgi:RimJ/RimL family protein N-acetyltransferase
MNFNFEEISLEQVQNTVLEADMNEVFLPSKNEPNFKVNDLFMQFYNNNNFHIFTFVDGIELTGFISILPTKEKHEFSIGPMFIIQRYQGFGLGKKQVIKVIEWAKSNNVRKLYTKTWGHNHRSRSIFQSLGFAFVMEIPNQRINGDSTVKYEFIM